MYCPRLCQLRRILSATSSATARLFLTFTACTLLTTFGCSGEEDTGGRVALQVSVTIDGKRAGNGTLVLRPKPGVQSPLIKVPVTNGAGGVSQSQGPVPGTYSARFRTTEGNMGLSEYLSKTGRIDPYAEEKKQTPAQQAESPVATRQIDPTEVVVPNKNPANVGAQFSFQ